MCRSGATCLEWYLVDWIRTVCRSGATCLEWYLVDWIRTVCRSGATCLEWYLVDSGSGQCVGVEQHVWSGIWLTRDQDNVSELSDMSGVVSG
jgi:hypothetical protein